MMPFNPGAIRPSEDEMTVARQNVSALTRRSVIRETISIDKMYESFGLAASCQMRHLCAASHSNQLCCNGNGNLCRSIGTNTDAYG